MTTKMILDCDTGVDDTMAIMYAALHPDIELLAVGTVWGNVEVEKGTRNSLRVLDLCGATEVPVAQGAAGPLLGGETEYAYHVHGEDGQGNQADDVAVRAAANTTAAQQIIDIVRQHPGEVWLVPVGPLTNIATALALDPELPKLVAGVSLMGGSAQAPGNVSFVAEANIWHDAEAAQAVFAASWPIIMAGLDVTMKVLITEDHKEQMLAGGEVGNYMGRIIDFYGEFYRDVVFGKWCCAMHDAIAVAAAAGHLDVKLAPTVNVQVDTTGGPGHGQTLVDLRGKYQGYPEQPGAHTQVLLEIDGGIADEIVTLIADHGKA